jgi:allophanate hydrolase subunit 1
MPIFVSYSRTDKVFATRLARQLVKHKANIWIDQWELRVGDSLIDRVQEAIQGASALLVILSKASVESEWCKKELSSGLIRELEEKRVVILPVLMEDCKIPIFLKDKLYADFRKSFDEGLQAILDAVARVTSDSLARVDRRNGMSIGLLTGDESMMHS